MEENQTYLSFLNTWHTIMWYLFLASMAGAVAIFMFYQLRYRSTRRYKAKYDIASRSEIKTYLLANYVLAAGIFFFINTVYDETVALSSIWFFIRIFISICIGTLHVYIAYLVFSFYYPKPLSKKLKKLRYTPRTNPSTGNKMKLLSEEEEDAYLDEGMQAEENAFSVDYDVWIDPATEETIIEKYRGHFSALECDRCGFQTLKLTKEEIITPPTEIEDGELEKEYECSYCSRIKRKHVKLTSHMDRDADHSRVVSNPLTEKSVQTVKVEIKSTEGSRRLYEFQSLEHAKKFLDEFEINSPT